MKSFREFFSDITLTIAVVIIGFIILFFFIHFISKYFEYDSDGVKVVVINRGLLLSDVLNYRERKLEFAKNKLYNFELKNYVFYKTLTFYLINSKQRKTKKTFNVTLVSPKKMRYVRQSLNKIVKANIKK